MPFVVTCPECGCRMRVPDQTRAQWVRCTECQAKLTISAEGVAFSFRDNDDANEAQPVPSEAKRRRRSSSWPSRPNRPGLLIAGTILGAGVIVLVLVVALKAWRGGDHPVLAIPFDPANYPPLPALKQVEPGIVVHEVAFPHGNLTRQIWVYLPERPAGKAIPCVLVAPAGSPLIYGSDLGDGGYRAEHLPYVRAGFAVVAYSIDGNLDDADRVNDTALLAAVRAFKDAEAGVANGREALEYALAQMPTLDRDRVYAAGHSSAATLALQLAEREPRIRACVAYAPVTNILTRTPPEAVDALAGAVPGFRDFLVEYSPHTHMDQLRCPVFLFHAEDDSNVSIRDNADFAAKLKATNPNVTFVRVPTGDHYDSMMREGIPQAIRWLQQLSAKE